MSSVWTQKTDASATFYLHLNLNVCCSNTVVYRVLYLFDISVLTHFHIVCVEWFGIFSEIVSALERKRILQLTSVQIEIAPNANSNLNRDAENVLIVLVCIHWLINFDMWSVCNYIPKNPRLFMHVNRFFEFAVNVLSECWSFYLNGS